MLGIPRICSIKKPQRVIESLGVLSIAAAAGHVQRIDCGHYKDRPEALPWNCSLSHDLCYTDSIYAVFLQENLIIRLWTMCGI